LIFLELIAGIIIIILDLVIVLERSSLSETGDARSTGSECGSFVVLEVVRLDGVTLESATVASERI